MWFRGKRNFHFELAWKQACKFAENSIHISCKQIHTMKMGLSPIKKSYTDTLLDITKMITPRAKLF